MFPSPGIGDILAICQLVVKIGMIINDIASGDVPQEFSELKEELRVLYEVLQSIKNINDTSLSFEASIALQRIQREAESCKDAMNEFLRKNSPPESKTRRAVWMIRVTKKAALLREKLSVHRENLGIFWNEFRHQQQADCSKKQSDMLNQLLTLAAEQSATSNGQTNLLSQLLILGRDQAINSNGHTDALSQLRNDFLSQLLAVREMAIEQASSLDLWRQELQILRPVMQGITLIDAVGSRLEVPFLFCRTYDLLSDVLLAVFKSDKRPGRNFVLRGDYNLVHGDAKDLISSSEWTSLLKPDLNVEMSMILRRDGAATDICPRCRTSFHGDASDGWATCLQCDAQFKIKQNIEEIEAPAMGPLGEEEITTPSVAALNQETVSRFDVHLPSPEEFQQPEWTLFRLLSIISTVFKLKPQESQVDSSTVSQDRFQNLQTGPADAQSQIEDASSISNQASMQQSPSSQLAVEFRQSIQMVGTIEGQFREFQQQAKTAVGTRDISTLRSVKERVGEYLKRAQEERDKWQQSLSNRAWPPDSIERIISQISSLVQRWSDNARKIELMMKNLDGAIQLFAQQSLQNNRDSNGVMAQQQWPGMQSTPQTQPSHMNPANGGLGATFSNPGANPHPGKMNMSAMQQWPSVGGSGQGLPSDQDPIRRNLASILAGHNMEPTVFIAGHSIDLYNLFVVGRQALQRPGGYNNNQVWQAVGAQLGLPSEGNPPLASAQAAAMLQEHYYKVNAIIEATKTNHIQSSTNQTGITPPNPNPPMSVSPVPGGGVASQQQIAANYIILQRAKQVYPTADFTRINQQMLANLPTTRFEQLLKEMGNKAQTLASNHVSGGIDLLEDNVVGRTNTGRSAPPRPNSAVQIQSEQTPVGQRQDVPPHSQHPQQTQQPQLQPLSGQGSGPLPTFSSQQIAEIKGVHQQVQAMWKTRYQARENPVPPPPPANLQTYRDRLSSCMTLLRVLLPALGLRYFLKKDEGELKNLVNFTALLVKQLTGLQNNPPTYYLSLESLSRICMLLQPIANEFNAMLQRINITPELQAVMSSGETAVRNLWGYMSPSDRYLT